MMDRLDGASFGRRLFDQAQDLDQAAVVLADLQDAVAVGLLARHFGHRDDVAAGLVIGVGELLQARLVGQHQVVRQQDGERVVADERAGAPDRVAEPERHLLAHGGDRARLALRAAQATPAPRVLSRSRRVASSS